MADGEVIEVNDGVSACVTDVRQMLSVVFDLVGKAGGLLWQTSLLCEFENGTGWKPKQNEDGTYAMTVTDEELRAMNFKMTAQELGQALYGVIGYMAAIPAELCNLIGRTRG